MYTIVDPGAENQNTGDERKRSWSGRLPERNYTCDNDAGIMRYRWHERHAVRLARHDG